MATKVISNILKRGKDVVRVAIQKHTGVPPPVKKTEHVRPPDLLHLHTPYVTPVRFRLFRTNVSLYKSLASQLRRRAAFEFGRQGGRSVPFLGFVGFALATNREEIDTFSEDIRGVLGDRKQPGHIIQQLSLNSFDIGGIIGKGCNAVVFEARCAKVDNIQRETTYSLENSSDSITQSLPPITEGIGHEEEEEEDKWIAPDQREITLNEIESEGEEEDKWYAPSLTEEKRETTDNFLSSLSTADSEESFVVIDEEMENSFCVLNFNENLRSTSSTIDDTASLMSYDESSTASMMSYDRSSDTDSCVDEDDKWLAIDYLEFQGMEDMQTNNEYNLALKIMYNYEVESKADSIMKAMEKETVPARLPIYHSTDSWNIGHRVRLKSLPQHPNVVDMVGAFVDPIVVPELTVAMETYPAALPKRLGGLGRNMTMYIVMKRYNSTLRQYLENDKPSMRTRCLLLAQLLEGIVHLGNHGVCHRDIKTDNLFLELPANDNEVPSLVIGDFGCCLADTEYGLELPYFCSDTDRGGNCALMAPEISTATPGRNVWLDYSKADLWAVGTLVYELFGLDNPFYGNQSDSVLDSRTYKEEDLPPLLGAVPEVVKCITQSMLCRDPKKRISPVDAANVMQLYLHFPDWFVSRPSIEEVKGHLLVLTAQVILQREDNQLTKSFLQRLNLNDIVRILNSFTVVDE